MKKIQHIAIIGAGLMGLGIGVEYARFGYDVNCTIPVKQAAKQQSSGLRKFWI